MQDCGRRRYDPQVVFRKDDIFLTFVSQPMVMLYYEPNTSLLDTVSGIRSEYKLAVAYLIRYVFVGICQRPWESKEHL